VRHTFPEGTVLPSGGSIVIFGGDNPQGAFGASIVQTTGSLGLNNGGDTVTLATDGAVEVATASYGSEGGNDQSLTRDPDETGLYTLHSTATGAAGAIFSPGTTVTGNSFSGSSFAHALPENSDNDTVLDFADYRGNGFAPNPDSGEFDSDNVTVVGWSDGDVEYGLTSSANDFARGESPGGVGTGGMYAFDVGGGNYAFGFQPSSGEFVTSNDYFEFKFANLSNRVLPTLYLGFDLLYYNDQGRSNKITVQYSTDGTTYFDVFDFTSPEGAASTPGWVTVQADLQLKGVGIQPDKLLYLKLIGEDVGGSGSRDEFAIDNITIGVPEPAGISILLLGMFALFRRRR
jgi:hypothetical protein